MLCAQGQGQWLPLQGCEGREPCTGVVKMWKCSSRNQSELDLLVLQIEPRLLTLNDLNPNEHGDRANLLYLKACLLAGLGGRRGNNRVRGGYHFELKAKGSSFELAFLEGFGGRYLKGFTRTGKHGKTGMKSARVAMRLAASEPLPELGP